MKITGLKLIWREWDSSGGEEVPQAYHRLYGKPFTYGQQPFTVEPDGTMHDMGDGIYVWLSYPGENAIYERSDNAKD